MTTISKYGHSSGAIAGFRSVYPAIETNVAVITGSKKTLIQTALNGITQGNVNASALVSLQRDSVLDMMVKVKHSPEPKEFRLEMVGSNSEVVLKVPGDINAYQYIPDGNSVIIGSSGVGVDPSIYRHVDSPFPALAFAVSRHGNNIKVDSMHAGVHLVLSDTHLKDIVREVIRFNARKLVNIVNVFGRESWRETPKATIVKHEDFGYEQLMAEVFHARFNLNGELDAVHDEKNRVDDTSFCVDLIRPTEGPKRFKVAVDFKPKDYGYMPSDKRAIVMDSIRSAQKLAGLVA